MRGRSTSQKVSLSEPCMTVPNEVWVAALHRTILDCGAASLCEVAHASNHGTDGSGPVRAGTILADAPRREFYSAIRGFARVSQAATTRDCILSDNNYSSAARAGVQARRAL